MCYLKNLTGIFFSSKTRNIVAPSGFAVKSICCIALHLTSKTCYLLKSIGIISNIQILK